MYNFFLKEEYMSYNQKITKEIEGSDLKMPCKFNYKPILV